MTRKAFPLAVLVAAALSTPAFAGDAAGCPRTRANAVPAPGARAAGYEPASLWPDNFQCAVNSVDQFTFATAIATKRKFEEASKVPCNDCEGGRSYDAWAHFVLVKGGNYKEKFIEMLVKLQVGDKLAWKGHRFNGTVQAAGQHPIGSTPCRQYRWTLKDGTKTVAERDGLLCRFTPEYSTTAVWRELV